MRRGFTLLEVLVSLSITLAIGAAVFQLFQQNERVFHDQYTVTEMQQGARAAIAQIAAEIRMAGQGTPVYAASGDAGPSEGVVAILSGSNSTRIYLRESQAPAETAAVAPTPLLLVVGTPATLTVESATGLYNAVGATPTGRFVFLWGDAGSSRWVWMRASVDSIVPSTKSVGVTVVEASPAGSAPFPAPPFLSLEEAVAIYFDAATASVRRTTATNMTDPTAPSWAAANELVTGATLMNFDYFDDDGNAVGPDSLADRARIARVDIRLVTQTTADLSNHTRPTYALAVRTNIRNRLKPEF